MFGDLLQRFSPMETIRTHIGSRVKPGEYLMNYTTGQNLGVEKDYDYGGTATVR
jgi:hypothetical protein